MEYAIEFPDGTIYETEPVGGESPEDAAVAAAQIFVALDAYPLRVLVRDRPGGEWAILDGARWG